MTFEVAELAGIGTGLSAVIGLAWKGLMVIVAAAKEQSKSQRERDDKMIDALTAMQRDAHMVIQANTVAIERGANATRDLTEAVERLTGRVELVERVVAKTETKQFQRAG
jgi:hypothetical protein